jgi:hypothetical protein
MSEPTISVLGVYRLPFDELMVMEQADRLYGAKLKGAARQEAERRCREQLASTVLVEACVSNSDSRFNVGDFAQPQVKYQRDSSQAAWAEVYLSVDGENRLQTLWPDPPKERDFRVAFFIHFWNPGASLFSSFGEIKCPPTETMPERLQRLAPYALLD